MLALQLFFKPRKIASSPSTHVSTLRIQRISPAHASTRVEIMIQRIFPIMYVWLGVESAQNTARLRLVGARGFSARNTANDLANLIAGDTGFIHAFVDPAVVAREYQPYISGTSLNAASRGIRSIARWDLSNIKYIYLQNNSLREVDGRGSPVGNHVSIFQAKSDFHRLWM